MTFKSIATKQIIYCTSINQFHILLISVITDNEKKVLQAAAIAQSQLGCPVIIHPGLEGGPAEDLRVLQEAGGDVSKTVMSHMDSKLIQST